MNKIKKAIRSLNPVVRMVIIAVLAAVTCIASGLYFGIVLGIKSATAGFALTLAATFFVVGVYVRLIEDSDE
nr:MAG TPA: Type II secretion system, protein M [Bacteriophage sp.]